MAGVVWATLATAIAVLAGWATNQDRLKAIVPGFETMKPLTALSIAALAGSTLALGSRRDAGTALGAVAVGVASVSGLEYLVNAGPWFDTLLFRGQVIAGGGSHPGRMAPMTSMCITALGGGLVAAHRGRTKWAHGAALAVLPAAGVALLGYLYGVESLRRVGPYSSVALHTALALLVLGLALLSCLPRGLVILAEQSAGARVLVRQGLPITVATPFAIGWLRLQAQHAGWFDLPFGLAVMAVSCAVVGATVLYRSAKSVAEYEVQLRTASQQVADLNVGLEALVEARTAALAHTEKLQRATLDSLEQGVGMLSITGEAVLLNHAGQQILGMDAAEVTRQFQSGTWTTYREDGTVLPADQRPISVTTSTGKSVDGAVGCWRTHAGHLITVRLSTRAQFDVDGAVTGVVIGFADITEERRLFRELEASRAHFAALVEHSSDMLVVLDPDGLVAYRSPNFPATTSADPRFWDLLHTEDRSAFREALTAVCDRPSETRRVELRIDDVGPKRHFEALLNNRMHESRVAGIVVNLRDVTERVDAASRLHHEAFHDSLTGLANRASLLDRLQLITGLARSGAEEFALLFLDLDGFKAVNDLLGHEAGDQLLRTVAARLGPTLRPGDTVARLGGDEFVVLVNGLVERSEATVLAERIIRDLAEPYHLDAGTAHASVSVGITFGSNDDPDVLLRQGDAALYRAKRRGKNRYEVFDDTLRQRAARRLSTEVLLRESLDGDGLVVHYQPIVDLHTSETIATEALLRVRSPSGGLLQPSTFLSIAEETGLIVAIGAGVLDQTCRQLAEWNRSPANRAPRRVSLNVSPRQLAAQRFPQMVADTLSRHEVDAHALILEMPESTILHADRATTRTINELAEIGLGLAVDDFGTGYSSLASLTRFPIDWLKLDRSLVAGLGANRRDDAIANAVLALGRALGLLVIAEGVETVLQLHELQRLGCDYAQGHLLTEPADPAQYEQQQVEIARIMQD